MVELAVEALRTLPINLLDQVQCRGKWSESLEPPLTSLSTSSVNLLVQTMTEGRPKFRLSSYITFIPQVSRSRLKHIESCFTVKSRVFQSRSVERVFTLSFDFQFSIFNFHAWRTLLNLIFKLCLVSGLTNKPTPNSKLPSLAGPPRPPREKKKKKKTKKTRTVSTINPCQSASPPCQALSGPDPLRFSQLWKFGTSPQAKFKAKAIFGKTSP